MISGQTDMVCEMHPKGVVALSYGAKLISANDSSGFTYRGRFTEARQASSIGYTASQKAHSALRWLSVNHGVIWGGRTFLCWNPEGCLLYTSYTELILKIATYAVVAVQVVSIFAAKPQLPQALIVSGIVLGVAGTFLFALSVITMKDSWRAGLAENDETEMITNGIYALSRNPAFLGFDCVYVGFVLMFFNVPLLLFSVFAMVMLHLQILQEEQYMIRVFGDTYLHYKSKRCV